MSLPEGENKLNSILLDEITASVEKINDYIQIGIQPIVQKAFSSHHIVALVIRIPGMTFYLYIGRGNESQGLAFSHEKIKSSLRIYDAFLGLIRNLCIGSSLKKVTKLSENTFLLVLNKKNTELIIILSWVDEQLYFGYLKRNQSHLEMFLPWVNPKKTIEKSDEAFKAQVGLLKTNKSFKSVGLKHEVDVLDKNEATLKKVKKSLGVKIGKIRKDLEKAKSWREWEILVNKAMSGEVELESLRELQCGSLIIKFKNQKHHHKINEIYQQIKRFKAKEEFIENRYKVYSEQLAQWNDSNPPMTQKFVIRKPVWANKDQKKIPHLISQKSLPEKIITLLGEVIIGRTADENDRIRNEWARKDDLWFHFEEIPGPHMYLRPNKDHLEHDEIVSLCSMLLSIYDKSVAEMKMVYTRVKYLKGVSGSKGRVTYQKAKYIKVSYCDNWRQNLSLLLEES